MSWSFTSYFNAGPGGLNTSRSLHGVQLGFGGTVGGLEQHNPRGTHREAGSLLSHHNLLNNPGLSLLELAMIEVQVHEEEGFDFIVRMIRLC